MNDPSPRLELRRLPLAVKLVVTLFLLSVGLGYLSALVQLHFQHAGASGEPLPTMKQAVLIFHGDDTEKTSRLERIIEGPADSGWSANMAPAFFGRADPPAGAGDAEREGERKAVIAWIRAGAPKRAYDNDAFAVPADWGQQEITKDFRDGNNLKVRSILTARCYRCHKTEPGGDIQARQYPLGTYEQVAKYTRIGEPSMSLEKLTQSTHVHLLSFSMLYALTGLVFAFTSYPLWVRLALAPLVLVVQVVDIGCWWLARIPGPAGEYFAMTIVLTGGLVAVGLVLQIVLSLFNMYDWSGKIALLVLFALAGVGGYFVNDLVIQPYLEGEKESRRKTSRLYLVLDGDVEDKFDKNNMVRAFYDKASPKGKPGDPAREGERRALIAWILAGAPKAAYDNDALPLPKKWGDQPITAKFRDGNNLKIRTLINSRCVRCHDKENGEDAKAIDFPLQTYEEVMKYVKP
jgi:hypothetical protein